MNNLARPQQTNGFDELRLITKSFFYSSPFIISGSLSLICRWREQHTGRFESND